jgi:cyclase
MVLPRIIPVLLIRRGVLYKSVGFSNWKYVGDPLNAVRIFNEKKVDEICVFDVDATLTGSKLNLPLIERLAGECRMPLCYGGGVGSALDFQKLVSLGVEKVAVGSSFISSPDLIRTASASVGSQSVSVVLDCKWDPASGGYSVMVRNASVRAPNSLQFYLNLAAESGVGEIIINSVDRDGFLNGYDLRLAALVRSMFGGPITFVGGAGSVDDIKRLVESVGVVGVGVGSLFVFKGKYRAVLINYISDAERASINASLLPVAKQGEGIA